MDTLQADIIEAGLYLFQFVYGDIMASLQDHRFTRYSRSQNVVALYPSLVRLMQRAKRAASRDKQNDGQDCIVTGVPSSCN